MTGKTIAYNSNEASAFLFICSFVEVLPSNLSSRSINYNIVLTEILNYTMGILVF